MSQPPSSAAWHSDQPSSSTKRQPPLLSRCPSQLPPGNPHSLANRPRPRTSLPCLLRLTAASSTAAFTVSWFSPITNVTSFRGFYLPLCVPRGLSSLAGGNTSHLCPSESPENGTVHSFLRLSPALGSVHRSALSQTPRPAETAGPLPVSTALSVPPSSPRCPSSHPGSRRIPEAPSRCPPTRQPGNCFQGGRQCNLGLTMSFLSSQGSLS